MHRRTLILRRFGDLSFGLGYYEDGVWVDHASADADRLGLPTSAAELAAIEAIHSWFDCCRDQDVTRPVAAEAISAGAANAVVRVASSSRA